MPYKIGMISLGCPKNQVDAEMMISKLQKAGFEITNQQDQADLIIVNTCGFIEDAKKESIESILETAQLKEHNLRALVVTGCLAERYKDEVIEQIPEIDAVIGLGANSDIVKVCKKALKGIETSFFPSKALMPLDDERTISTPGHWAYLKIADGCSNRCSYCAIPGIRGDFRSREIGRIVDEAQALAGQGVKELVVIAQDTTRYGIDLYGTLMLPTLLKKLVLIEGIEWIRLFYCYPDRITDELLEVMRDEKKICHYIDIPLQHAHGTILKRMNRTGDEKSLTSLVHKIRSYLPDVSLRTTFMVGFPGEGEKEFETLCRFIEENEFDRLGCFAYSPEEDTPAAEYADQIEDTIKQRRAEVVMNQQFSVSERKNLLRIGKRFRVIVDGFDPEMGYYRGRSYMDAPEIDTGIYFTSDKKLTSGCFVSVVIDKAGEYDLFGKAEED